MKKILLSMAALLVLGSSVSVDAQRHRHTPRTENVVSASSAKKDDASKSGSASKSKDEGIEAFSDTSSVDTSSSVVYNGNGAMNDSDSYDSDSDTYPFAMFENIFASKFWVVTFLVIIILLGLMPLIIVVLLIRYLVKRHNDQMRLAEKAMESGQPISDEQMPLSKKSPDYMWRRGIRNVSIGIGLMVFFWFLGVESLAGIGGLVACLGAGQMFMVRYNYNSKFGRRKFDDDELNKM